MAMLCGSSYHYVGAEDMVVNDRSEGMAEEGETVGIVKNEWKRLAEIKQKGFVWVDGILKEQVENGLTGIKEVVVIPKGLR